MTGKAYFYDDHTEEILRYVKHNDDAIEFYTQSGRYYFGCFITGEKFKARFHKFFKHDYVLDDWLVTLDINYIEIYEEE